MHSDGAPRATIAMRVAGWLLAIIGLGPLLWAGFRNTELGVARLAFVDPLIVVALSAIAAVFAPRMVAAATSAIRDALLEPSDALFSSLLFIWVVAASIGLSWYCFGGQAIVTDELTQAFQGRILLSGHFAAHAEALREFFETAQTVNRDGRWFAESPVGAPLLSAIGELIRLPWLIDPLIAGLAGLGLYRIAVRIFGRGTARVAGILFAASPFVLLMAATRLNHTATMAALVLALMSLARWVEATDERHRQLAAVGIGVGVGLISLFRPYDAVLTAVPIGLFQLWTLREMPRRARSLPLQIIAALLVSGVQLYFNWRTTGHPFEFAYDALNGTEHRPGFHIDPTGQPFTPARGAYWVAVYLLRLNATLFETPVPAMVFIAGAFLVARRASRWDWLLLGVFATTLIGYWAYWFPGLFPGARFLFLATPALIMISARFVIELWRRPDSTIRRASLLLLPVSVAFAWLMPSTTGGPTGVWRRVAEYRSLAEPRNPDVDGDARKAGIANALVFVREPFHRRLAARLRALGMRPYAVEQIIPKVDACALFDALNAVDSLPRGSRVIPLGMVLGRAQRAGSARGVAGLLGSRSLALVDGRPSSPACANEISNDDAGTAAFELFLANEHFGRDGRLAGDVVYARDLGAKNEALRARFGDRRWYRYHSVVTPSGPIASFVPY